MYLTPYQKKQLRIVLILVIGIPLTLFGAYKAVQWFTSAGADTQPKSVVLANLTTNSVTVTWTTENKQNGSVVTVLNNSEEDTFVDKRGTGRRNTHYVELKNLEPGTKYSFRIISGDDTYTATDNAEFVFTTVNISTDTPTPKPVHGQLDTNTDDALIYILPKDKSTYPVATIPSSNGNWLVDLSALTKISDKSRYSVSDSTELVLIASSGVDNGNTVQGTYVNIFDSSGGLTETLVATGEAYDTYLGDKAKLIATQQNDTADDQNDDSDSYTPSVPGTNDDTQDDFDRDYQLKSDLAWVDLVSSNGSTVTKPQSYGPDTVTITNVTDVSFTVLWLSEEKEGGYIMYGTDETDLGTKGRDERDGITTQNDYYLHSIEVTQLEPETTYYFEIYSGEQVYEETYEVTTFATQSTPPEFETISGTADVTDYNSFAVIAQFVDDDEVGSLGTSYPISTLIDSEGSWILTIGSARDEEGSYFTKSSGDIVQFNPIYLSTPEEVETTVGEATTQEVELTVSDSSSGITKVQKLSDYGILID